MNVLGMQKSEDHDSDALLGELQGNKFNHTPVKIGVSTKKGSRLKQKAKRTSRSGETARAWRHESALPTNWDAAELVLIT